MRNLNLNLPSFTSYLSLFFVLILILLSVVFFGLHPTDHEFISSLAYRISLDQLPYKDFDYVRPPLSLYLHSISFDFFPLNAMIISRLVFFLQMFMIAHLSTKILIKINLIKNENTLWYTLIFLLLSLHNFPAMPWHTVDGLLFLLIGLYFLINGISKNKIHALIISGIFCGLAALCKQNYLLLSPVYLAIAFAFCRLRFFYVLLGLAISGGLFLLYLSKNDLFSFFFASQSDNSSIYAVFISILKSFQLSNTLVLLPSIVVFSLLTFCANQKRISKKIAVISSVCFFIFLSIVELYVFQWGSYANPKFLYQIAWVASIYFFITNKNTLLEFLEFNNFIMIALFLIGFSSMISWGNPYPNLYNAPFFAILFKQLNDKFGDVDIKKIFYFILVCWLLISNIMYRDSYKILAHNNLGNLFPKLNHIYVGDRNYLSYRNIKEISSDYDIETVIPGFPLFSYLNDNTPNFKIDWFRDPEATLEAEEYLEDMAGKYFIIMNECFEYDTHPKRILVCSLIKNNSELVRELENLKLYRFDGIRSKN